MTKIDQEKLPQIKIANFETVPNSSLSSIGLNNSKSVNSNSRNMKSDAMYKTTQVSRYQQGKIPTSNLKIQQFMDIIFGS